MNDTLAWLAVFVPVGIALIWAFGRYFRHVQENSDRRYPDSDGGTPTDWDGGAPGGW